MSTSPDTSGGVQDLPTLSQQPEPVETLLRRALEHPSDLQVRSDCAVGDPEGPPAPMALNDEQRLVARILGAEQ